MHFMILRQGDLTCLFYRHSVGNRLNAWKTGKMQCIWWCAWNVSVFAEGIYISLHSFRTSKRVRRNSTIGCVTYLLPATIRFASQDISEGAGRCQEVYRGNEHCGNVAYRSWNNSFKPALVWLEGRVLLLSKFKSIYTITRLYWKKYTTREDSMSFLLTSGKQRLSAFDNFSTISPLP